MRRAGSGYEAIVAWGRGSPIVIQDAMGRSDASGRRHILLREISGPIQGIGLAHGQTGGMWSEGSAEAIVAQRGDITSPQPHQGQQEIRSALRAGRRAWSGRRVLAAVAAGFFRSSPAGGRAAGL